MIYTFDWNSTINNCALCPLEDVDVDYDSYVCLIACKSTKDVRLQFSRPLWCPLIEGGAKIEEVKQDGERAES